jgi:NAD(P)H-hydrate epimerase
MRIVTTDQMKKMDSETISRIGSGLILMEKAGRSVFEIVIRFLTDGKKVLILCGPGNNGGDGWVVARLLHENGHSVYVLSTVDPESLKNDAYSCMKKAIECGITYYLLNSYTDSFNNLLHNTSVIVDAVFGTGLNCDVPDDISLLFECVNHSGIPVVAVDIPSGIEGDTGKIRNNAIKASHTVTFHAPKPAHYFYPGREYIGELSVSDIGIYHGLSSSEHPYYCLNENDVSFILPKRIPDGHKGMFGKGYLLSGSRGMTGAAYLCAKSFLRSGAGLCFTGCPSQLNLLFLLHLLKVLLTHYRM